ncbi:MAG: PAS domain S-box protein [Betaproteobacteria bacterium]|nr:PAS domain S-box protein [Betaproteobacteria bacterium]
MDGSVNGNERPIRRTPELDGTAIAITDPEGRILECTPACCGLTARSEDELRGMPLAGVFHADDTASHRAGTARLLAGAGSGFESEGRLVRRDGESVPVRASVTILRDGTARPPRLVVILKGASDRSGEADCTRRTLAQLAAVIAQAPFSAALFDRSMNYLAASDRWMAAYGRGLPDLVGRNHYDLHPELPEEWKRAHRQGLAGQSVHRKEDRWVRPDGREHWLRWSVVPWRDANGDVGGIVISSEDVTHRKLAERALRESTERLAGIVNSAMDAIISVDENQRIRVFNTAAERMFGMRATQALDQPLSILMPERFRKTHHQDVERYAESGRTSRRMGEFREIVGLRANGEEFPVEASLSKVDLEHGRFLTVIVRDVSERRRHELAMRRLRGAMEQVASLHAALESAVAIADELDRPLAAVRSHSDAALRMLHAGDPRPERLAHALEACAQQAKRAGQVMRELAEFLQKGDVAVRPVDLNEIVRRALAAVESDGPEGAKLVAELPAGLPPVLANALQLEKVVVSIVRTGMEALQTAGVRGRLITISVRTTAGAGAAQVTVRDSEPGPDPGTPRQASTPFFTREPRGIGPGLAISRAVVESYGGRLWVDTDDGPGAVFHFTVPYAT